MRSKFFSAGLWSAGVSYILFATNFICNIGIARILGPELYGIYVLAASIQVICGIFLTTPINWVFIGTDGSQKSFDTLWILSLAMGVANIVVGILGGVILGIFYGYVVGLIFFILASSQLPLLMATIYLADFEKNMDFKVVSITTGVSGTFGALLALLAAWLGYGVWSLAARDILPTLISFFLAFKISKLRFSGNWQIRGSLALLRKSTEYSVTRIIEQCFFRLPFVLISNIFGPFRLALINQALYLASLPNTLLSPISERIAFPNYVMQNGDHIKVSRSLFITNFFIVRLVIPIGLGVSFFGGQLISVLYGSKWEMASDIFISLALFTTIAPLFANVKTACMGLNRQSWVHHAYLISILVLFTAIFLSSQIDSIKILSIGYGLALLFGILYMFVRLSLQGITLRLYELFTLPLLYSVMFFSFSIKQNSIQELTTNSAVYLFILILLYPILILIFEGGKILQYIRNER